MHRSAEPKIMTALYDLTVWYMARTERFPKPLRVSLGDRIDTKLLDMLELANHARFSKQPKKYLQSLNLELESLRFLSRLARDRGGLQIRQFEFAARSIEEIGRQIGGWLRQIAQHENTSEPVSQGLGL
jgi:hypothetical protein